MYLEIDRSGAVTLKKQVYDRIIQRILDGTLSGGEKMPSSRYLSEKLKVSRNIILEAYEQLIAEGYLEAVTGSGTFVAGDLALPPEKRRTTPQEIPIGEELSFTHQKGIIDFISGIPDLTDFPCRNWIQCQRTVERYSDPTIWDLGEIRGQYSLRSEIARYLERRNGIHVSPGQIFITSGVSQAVLLASLFIRKKRSGVLVENPVVWFVPEVFRETGHTLTPVDADFDGLRMESLPDSPSEGILFLSPSHQFPLGGTLSIQKRIEVTDYAEKHGLCIIEDDYDGEFRHRGAPVNSLFTLAPGRVIHMGTFSKNISPALRLGYMVVPVNMVHELAHLKEELNIRTPSFTQEVMALYISQGHFERRILRMRRLYTQKMERLTGMLAERFGSRVVIHGNSTGLHIAAVFPGMRFTTADSERFLKNGVRVYFLHDFDIRKTESSDTMVLGYGALSLDNIAAGVDAIHRTISQQG